MIKKESREYIITERPNGLGRNVIPYGATYKEDPEYMYIRVIEKQAYDELKAQLEIAKEALSVIKWNMKPEVKKYYPELKMYRCPTCISAEYTDEILKKLETTGE